MSNKHVINLLQAELLPQTPLLSLKRVVLIWGLTLVLMIMVMVIGQYQLTEAEHKNKQLKSEKTRQSTLQTDLAAQISKRRPDPRLVETLATLKFLITHKKAIYINLTDDSKTYVAGFAKAMTELADIHQRDISLQKIVIAHNDVSFTGVARSPDAVPLWMAGFKQASLLVGKSFTYFKLAENEQHYTEFVVSSNEPKEDK